MHILQLLSIKDQLERCTIICRDFIDSFYQVMKDVSYAI